MTSLVPVMMIAMTTMWLNEDNGLKIAGMLSILVVNRY
jgi:hypothetical protein